MITAQVKNDKPIVGVFFNRLPDSFGYLYESKQFREYLPELVEVFEKQNIRLVVLCEESSYIGMGLFTSFWIPSSKTKGIFKKTQTSIKPDIVYDKGHFGVNDGYVKLINSSVLSKVGRNKYTQSVLFSKWQPASTLLLPFSDASKGVGQINSKLILVKPLHLNGGNGIEVCRLDQLMGKSYTEPVLLQEFIETNQGIPGVIAGRHDLRLYILNGKIRLASVRTPKVGSFLSNTGQGGTISSLDLNLIPEEPQQIAKQIDQVLKKYGDRYYSVDLMFDGKKWWMIEMNDRPAILARFQGTHVLGFHQAFAEFFKEALNLS